MASKIKGPVSNTEFVVVVVDDDDDDYDNDDIG